MNFQVELFFLQFLIIYVFGGILSSRGIACLISTEKLLYSLLLWLIIVFLGACLHLYRLLGAMRKHLELETTVLMLGKWSSLLWIPKLLMVIYKPNFSTLTLGLIFYSQLYWHWHLLNTKWSVYWSLTRVRLVPSASCVCKKGSIPLWYIDTTSK